jgi:hypothetical protein
MDIPRPPTLPNPSLEEYPGEKWTHKEIEEELGVSALSISLWWEGP